MTGLRNQERAELFGDGAMTVEKASESSGIGRTTLYQLMTQGELPYSKVGVRRLIPRRALVELLATGADIE